MAAKGNAPVEATIGITELGGEIDRKPATIRMWESTKRLPKHLRSYRNDRGWRVWTPDQVEAIKQWMQTDLGYPGSGLPGYHPTEAELAKHREGQRQPRSGDRELVA